MSRYWLTFHWPHPQDPADDYPWSVYFQSKYKHKAELLSPGDQVLFYETSRGRLFRRWTPEGFGDVVPLKKGEGGIVCIAEVAGPPRLRPPNEAHGEYADGTAASWSWEVPCVNHIFGETVGYDTVREVTGRGSMRVPGGLLELAAAQFDDLRAKLLKGWIDAPGRAGDLNGAAPRPPCFASDEVPRPARPTL